MLHCTERFGCIAKTKQALLLAATVAIWAGQSSADNELSKSFGYWSDPNSWTTGALPTSDADSPHASIRNNGILAITNGDEAVCSGFNIKGGILDMEGGSLTTSVANEPFYIGFSDGWSAKIRLSGGVVRSAGVIHVANSGNGALYQTGGDLITGNRWITLGQNADSVGTVVSCGGSIQVSQSNGGLTVGHQGCGYLYIGGSSMVTSSGSWGVSLGTGDGSGSTNAVMLSSGGTLSVQRITDEGYGFRSFVMDGGTLCTATGRESLVSNSSNEERQLSEFAVTARGGTIDTRGNDVAIRQPLTLSDKIDRASLLHRWSFNGDAKDSIGGGQATLNGSASLDAVPGRVVLPGGAKGTAWVSLGSGLLPTGDAGFTVEIWATIANTNANWQRLFDIGSNDNHEENIYSAVHNSGTDPVVYCNGTRVIIDRSFSYLPDTPYHIVLTVAPKGDGGWQFTQYIQSSGGEFLSSQTGNAPEGWSPSGQGSDWFMLGHSAGNDSDLYGSFDEVRIWNRPLSAMEVTMNCAAGPDAVAGALVKAGNGTLTLTGENTFTAPLRVEKGTLALAAGATLASGCGVSVATNAMLSLASGAYPKGTVTFDVSGRRDSGRILAEGTLDLSKLSISVPMPSEVPSGSVGYTIIEAAAFTGEFASVDIPSPWILIIGANRVSVGTCGLILCFR